MALLGGLIHNFTITETRRLEKFTVYKVHMISFPRNSTLFSSLTKLSVYKRYSEFKTLQANLSKIHKNYNLKNFFKAENSFFKRFDPAVIEQRKSQILQFLYFCADNPVIYRSQYFVKFFEEGNSSPTEEIVVEPPDEPNLKQSVDESSIETQSQNNSIELEDEEEPEEVQENTFDHLSTGFDYLYDAAMCFSQAVQEEANLRYKQAFELYKLGIDKLLTGAKSDTNEKRKRIAKTKAGKYLERAETLYETHIAQLQEENFVFEDPADDETTSVFALERPVNNLARFKVIGINNYTMKVSDTCDKKFYVLKTVYKDDNSSIFLPQSIPFMIKLISFYKTENSIFLLLPMVAGGLLWDYINTYSNKSEPGNLEELFVDPPKPETFDKEEISEEIQFQPDVEVADEVEEEVTDALASYNPDTPAIPSFETLSSEMDINDLMSCSLSLLNSVSKTLEKSQIQAKVSKPLEVEAPQPATPPKPEPKLPELAIKSPKETTKLPEAVLKQWACELIVAVNSLHKVGVVCGDLNLDNLLLGPSGHLTLTYFYQNDRSEFQSICRLNPKALKCLYVAFDFPLTKQSDWYSVGVLIYEIVTRERFYVNHPMGVFRFNEIQFTNPDDLSEELKDLLHNLIIEKGEKRFKYEEITCHSYFEGVDWAEVEKCGLELFKI